MTRRRSVPDGLRLRRPPAAGGRGRAYNLIASVAGGGAAARGRACSVAGSGRQGCQVLVGAQLVASKCGRTHDRAATTVRSSSSGVPRVGSYPPRASRRQAAHRGELEPAQPSTRSDASIGGAALTGWCRGWRCSRLRHNRERPRFVCGPSSGRASTCLRLPAPLGPWHRGIWRHGEGSELVSDARDVWTVPDGDGWANRRAGSAGISNRGRRKADVVRIGRAMARLDGVEHVILKQTGEVQRRSDYSRRVARRSPIAVGRGPAPIRYESTVSVPQGTSSARGRSS